MVAIFLIKFFFNLCKYFSEFRGGGIVTIIFPAVTKVVGNSAAANFFLKRWLNCCNIIYVICDLISLKEIF